MTRTTVVLGVVCVLALTVSAGAQALPSVRWALQPVPAAGISAADCDLPAVPNAPPQRVAVALGHLVEWCVQNATSVDQARAADWSVAVDFGAPTRVAAACKDVTTPTQAVLCYALVPAAAVTALAPAGVHTLSVSTPSLLVDGLTVVSAELERPSCVAFGVRYDVGAPLPNTAPALAAGALYSIAGAYTVERLIGQLRQDGWHVEWLRTQWTQQPKTVSDQLLDPGGAFWVFGWCRGVAE